MLRQETRIGLSQPTMRGFSTYSRLLRLGPAELKGPGHILDVCSGYSLFAREVNDGRTEPKVIAVEPQASKLELEQGYIVEATAQQLPFDDDTFEHSFMLWGASYMSRQEASTALRELMRVTQPEGTVRVSPINAKKLGWRSIDNDPPQLGKNAFLRAPLDKRGWPIQSEAALIIKKPAEKDDHLEGLIAKIDELDALRVGKVLNKIIVAGAAARMALGLSGKKQVEH